VVQMCSLTDGWDHVERGLISSPGVQVKLGSQGQLSSAMQNGCMEHLYKCE
jgi:hypothetical protein